MGHLDHWILAFWCWRIRSETLQQRNMVRLTLHRQHWLDSLSLAGIHVGRNEEARIGQSGPDLSEHLWQGLNLIQYRAL